MLKGMRKVKKVAKRLEDERGDWGAYVPFFKLDDGESAIVRFNGSEDEPHIFESHSIRRGNKFSGVNCAKDTPGHDGCVGCWSNSNGDKGVGRPASKGAFNLIDHRWYHKLLDREKSDGENKRYKYILCSDDARCKYCRKKKKREHGGQKRVTFALQWAQLLAATDEKLSKKCKSCGVGRVKAVGYEDEDGEPVDPPSDDEELEEAIESGEIFEVLECNKCEEPERCTLNDALLEVTRVGSGTNTTYKFDIEEIVEMEEWETECEPGDLEAQNKPLSAEKQAGVIGVQNPFGNSADDEIDEWDDEDEEDEEEKPRRGRGRRSRRRDDDEDDDEDEDDDVAEPFDDEDDDEDDDPPPRRRSKKKVVKKKVRKKVAKKSSKKKTKKRLLRRRR